MGNFIANTAFVAGSLMQIHALPSAVTNARIHAELKDPTSVSRQMIYQHYMKDEGRKATDDEIHAIDSDILKSAAYDAGESALGLGLMGAGVWAIRAKRLGSIADAKSGAQR